MATAGSIVVSLLASTGSFETDMQRASRRVKSTTSDFDRAAEAAKKFGMVAGTAALAFASATAAIVMNAAKSMDATSKMAQQIGVTTEALTGMRFAVQQFASISDQQFDQAMRRMTRRIEEAAAGSGSAKAALEEMGLSARELSRMTPDRQMLALADAMKRTESQANRLRYTMAIFDTEGMALVPALQQGAAALEENIQLAQKYGVVLSTEAARAAEEFNTNLSHLGSMLDGLKMQLASEILPTLNQFISNVITASTEVDGLHTEVKNLSGNTTFKSWFDATLVGMARVADVAVFVAKAIGVIGGAFRSVAADAEVAVAAINKAQAWNWFSEEASNELSAALSRRNEIVGGFNKDLADLFTYQGNKYEQAALQAISTIRLTSDEVKLVDLTTQGATKSANDNSAARKRNTATVTEAQRAAAAFRREQEQSLRAQYDAVSAINQQAQALEDQIAVYGLSKTAIEDLTIARLEEQRVMLDSLYGDKANAAVEAIEAEIEARKRLRTAIGSMEQKEAERANWESWASDVEQIFNRVGQSLTDAIFDGGKSAKDLLKDVFKGLTFNVLINPVMQAGQQWVTNQLGGMMGYSNPQGGGFGMSGMPTLGAGTVQNAGGWLASSGVSPDLGAKMVMNADKIATTAGNILGYGKAIWDLSEGKYGSAAGTAIGTWFGGPIGGAIGSTVGGLVDGLFDREPTTRREQRTQIEFANGLFGTTRTDSRMPGADQAARALAEQAVQTANDIFRQVGVDAAIDSFHAIMASSHKRDRDGVASGGRLRIGDEYRAFGIANEGNPTIQGFGGWSDRDPASRLAIDISMSLMEALQAAGVMAHRLDGLDIRGMAEDQVTALATTIQQVIQEVTTLQQAVTQLPFANLRDLSFEAYDGLLALTGGLDGLIAAEQSYLQNFYSEAERTQLTWDAIARTLSEVNVSVPQTRAEFRAIKESLDLNSESGREAYAAIMSVQDAFASVTPSAEDLAQATIATARERAGLEAQLLQLQGNTAELRRRELAGLDASNHALQRHIWALQDQAAAAQTAAANLESAFQAVVQAGQAEIQRLQQSFGATDTAMSAYRSAVQRLESEFGSLFTSIDRYVSDLRGNIDAAARQQYDQARAVISTALVTGQLPQTASLTDALRVAQQGVTGQVYASRLDQERAYAILANEMEALKGIAEPELDAAKASLEQLERQYRLMRGMSLVGEDSLLALEQQLRTAISTEQAARSQIAAIEEEIDIAREQYNVLLEIRDGILSFPDALAEFAKAVSAVRAPASGGGVGSGGGLPTGPGSDYERAVQYYRDNPDVAAAFNRTPGATFAEFAKEHYEKYGRNEGRPSFAVGINYVPYDMTARIHEGERIMPKADNAELMRRLAQPAQTNQALERRVEELVAENKKMSAYLYQITKETKRTALNTEDTAMAVAHGDQGGAVVVYG